MLNKILREQDMGLFDELGKAMKQVETEINKAELDKQIKELEQGMNKAGHELSAEIKKAQDTPASGTPQASDGKSAPARTPHPGYAKITAWVKRTCGSRIGALSDPSQRTLELEQITTDACSGMSEKTRKGFLAYLKSQHYEQLLK
jgi:hypothetical protein